MPPLTLAVTRVLLVLDGLLQGGHNAELLQRQDAEPLHEASEPIAGPPPLGVLLRVEQQMQQLLHKLWGVQLDGRHQRRQAVGNCFLHLDEQWWVSVVRQLFGV